MATLNFQVLGESAEYPKIASKGAWTKVLRAKHIPPVLSLGGLAYYRPSLTGDDGPTSDGAGWAQKVFASFTGGLHPTAVAFRNEMQSGAANQVKEFFAYKKALRSFGYRGLVVFGSFGVGTPDYPEWPAIVAAVKLYGDGERFYIELHEYWDLSPDWGNKSWAWRHVKLLDEGLIPPDWGIFIGEAGSDALGAQDSQGRGGWDDRDKLSADQEARNLVTYAQLCAGQVEAVFVFGDYSDDPRWVPYRTIGTSQEQVIRETWAMATAVPEINQGPTKLCGYAAVEECFVAAGGKADMVDLYQRVKGYAFSSPGDASSFQEIVKAVNLAAQDNNFTVTWAPGSTSGVINDFPSFESGIRQGYYTIAGLAAQDVRAGQNFGHFIVCTQETYDASGAPLIQDVDSYRDFDGFPKYIPLAELEQAIRDNWDPNAVCIAFRLSTPTPVSAASASLSGDELDAHKYYTQNGVGIDPTHGVWTFLLYPAWVKYHQLVSANDPMADVFRLGPLTQDEAGATWGPSKLPAATVRLTNRKVGVHLDSDKTWNHPYQVEI